MSWPTAVLGELCNIRIGRTPSRDENGYWESGDRPWVSIGDITRSDRISKTKELITRRAVAETGCKEIAAGTVLMSFKLSIGKVAIAEVPLFTNEAIAALEIKRPDRLNSRFLFRAIESIDFHDAGNRAAMGRTLNKQSLSEIEIPLPPLDQQLRIATTLDKADALRRKRKRSLELLESFRHSIFATMFSKLDERSTVAFDECLIAPLRNGLSLAKAGVVPGKILTLSAITGGAFKSSATKEGMFLNAPPDNQRVEQGEFLICRGNGNKSLVGVGVFASVSMPDTAFPDTIIAGRIDIRKFHPQFFQDVWNGRRIRDQIEKSARTTNGTFKVNQQSLGAIRIPMPNVELQEAYSEKVTSIKKAKIGALEQLSLLDGLYSSLQSCAFSGQL